MYQEEILRSFTVQAPREYMPRFHVESDPRGWRIFDGDTAIAFGWPTFCDIWSFSPFEQLKPAHTEPPGKVVDLHTVHNTVINFALHGWPKHWCASPERLTWNWEESGGPELQARISAEFEDGERIQWILRVEYDPGWARYRYKFAIDAWKLAPDGMEPFNMMLAGALTARAANRRWTHSLWEDPDGNIRRIVHSNALFMSTDYASSEWRARNAPYKGAWVAYAADPSFNPTMLIHRTNVPIRLGICSQLFDEHIIWNTAGQENIDENGMFHFQMTAEFVNMKPDMAVEFLDRAIDPVRPKQWRDEKIPLPFYMDTVNSFEDTVDPWEPEDCPVIAVPKGDGDPVAWGSDEAHSGKRSIRMEGTGDSERHELFPCGAVCNVHTHRRYRLSGWIKTRGVDRFARLELAGYEYTYTNVIDSANSGRVAGDSDWTRVSVELDSGDEAYLMPKLVLYGRGTAWFDDILLEEVQP